MWSLKGFEIPVERMEDPLLMNSGTLAGPKRVVPLDTMSIPTPKMCRKPTREDLRLMKLEVAAGEYFDDIDSILANTSTVGLQVKGESEPLTYEEALNSKRKDEWQEAMAKEWHSLLENKTFELCLLPPDRKAIGCKWVYKIKKLADGSVDRLKARLCAIGTSQVYGFDYTATFAPVVRHENLRTILAYGALHDLEIHQMDVDSAFLNGSLEEEIYMRQPKGFVHPEAPKYVLRLLKSLYGLKQAPRVWNMVLTRFLLKHGFSRSKADPCIFYKSFDGEMAIVAIYVDDCCIVAPKLCLQSVKDILSSGFSMKDLGEAKSLLGMQIIRNRNERTIKLVQSGMVNEIVAAAKMEGANSCKTPMEVGLKLMKASPNNAIMQDTGKFPYRTMVGMLLYLSVGSRPDIAFAVNYLSRFVTCYDEKHWKALKRVVRYIKGTSNLGVTYGAHSELGTELIGFGDADWGSDEVDRRSTSGNIFFFGGGPISWKSRKQVVVAISTVEAEYLSCTDAVKQALHHRVLLRELAEPTTGPTVIRSDNQGCIALTENPCHHERTKHFDIRHHFIREKVEDGDVKLRYLPTGDMVADIMTKALPATSFCKFRGYLCS
jgi:Reverse transcriptase (RNA-dependent DNA polymerase)